MTHPLPARWRFLAVAGLTLLTAVGCVSVGRLPSGDRLRRIEQSPNYRDGKFQNYVPARRPDPSKMPKGGFLRLLFPKNDGVVRPAKPLPLVKTDLKALPPNENLVVWLGHSSLFLQVDGKRILIDPVMVQASPFSLFNKPFLGTTYWKPQDLPDADFLLISHDHWDHLDYWTVKKLKKRVKKVVCGLGVGEDFEYWGYDKEQIVELDWWEKADFGGGFSIYCLPARHTSGRLLTRDKTLWAGYMIVTPHYTIFYSGDGGYDGHFAAIAKKFPKISLAIMENGQYNEAWPDIHLLPQELVLAVNDLHPERLLTVHNSKYALSTHPWYAPLENITNAWEKGLLPQGMLLYAPLIGQVVNLDTEPPPLGRWWK